MDETVNQDREKCRQISKYKRRVNPLSNSIIMFNVNAQCIETTFYKVKYVFKEITNNVYLLYLL